MAPRVRRLGLALALVVGCHARGSRPPSERDVSDAGEIRHSPSSREAFEDVVRRYREDVPDGRPRGSQCQFWADAFTRVYRYYGIQMTLAAGNAAAIWVLCRDPLRAERDLAKLLLEVPRYTAGYNDLAVLRWRRGARAEAIAALEQALAIIDDFEATHPSRSRGRAPPNDTTMRENLATMVRLHAIEAGDPTALERAEQRIRELLEADASVLALYEELALVYVARAEHDGPRMLIFASLVIDQGRDVARRTDSVRAGLENAAGLVALARDDQREAMRCFERAIAAEPRHTAAQANLGMLAVRRRDHATARAALERAIAAPAPKPDLDASLALAQALIGEREYEAARTVLVTAARTHVDARPWYMLGVLDQDFVGPAAERAEGGRFDAHAYERARASFRRALRHPSSARRAGLVAAAQARMTAIDGYFGAPTDVWHPVAEEAARLEADARKHEAAEKVRLRELERKLRALQ